MTDTTADMSAKGYWPAVALEYFKEKKYSRAVELCTLRLTESDNILSGRVVLARALYHSGQVEAAEEEFYRILHKDPENLIALKYLGDIKFSQRDETTSFSYYNRVLEIEPRTAGLASQITRETRETTRVLTLKKGEEKTTPTRQKLRELPFKTETVGDLLLAQGHPRLALEIFRGLAQKNENPRYLEKIEKIQSSLKYKDGKNV